MKKDDPCPELMSNPFRLRYPPFFDFHPLSMSPPLSTSPPLSMSPPLLTSPPLSPLLIPLSPLHLTSQHPIQYGKLLARQLLWCVCLRTPYIHSIAIILIKPVTSNV